MAQRQWIWLVVLILTSSGIIYSRYQEVIKCPSCHLFIDSADGLKNYFTPAFYTRHDSGLRFTGMNYPAGEHIIYTDNQPVWSILIANLDKWIAPVSQHTIGILNLNMLLSIILSGLCLFLIFQHFRIPSWYSAFAALVMAFMSPQIARFVSHYALAYSFYIPLFLLLFLKWQRYPKRWLFPVMLTVFGIWMGLTHLYYLMIISLFCLSYALILFVAELQISKKVDFRKFTRAIPGVLPLLLVFLFVKITDPVADRPVDVHGLEAYTARLEGTFLPFDQTFTETWKALKIKEPDFERRAYVGLVCTLLMPFTLIWMFWRRRKFLMESASERTGIRQLFLSGLLVWLFSTGVIYQIGFSFLLEMIPGLKQFRSLGRLAWLFYYTCGITSLYLLHHIFQKLFQKKMAGKIGGCLVLILCLGYFGWESWTFFDQINKKVIYNNNFLDPKDHAYTELLNQEGVTPDDFQCILQLPMFCVGSEKLLVDRGIWTQREGMRCAYQTGLSLMNINMSRTSVSQSLQLLQMLGSDLIPKERLANGDSRDILLLVEEKFTTPPEQRLLERARYIGSLKTIDLYALSPATLDSIRISAISHAMDVVSLDQPLVYASYDTLSASRAFAGKGARSFEKSTGETFFEYSHDADSSAVLDLSFWMYLDEKSNFPSIRYFSGTAPDDTAPVRDYSFLSNSPIDIIGPWSKIEIPLDIKGRSYHRFEMRNTHVLIDELMLTTRGDTVIDQRNGKKFLNNTPLGD